MSRSHASPPASSPPSLSSFVSGQLSSLVELEMSSDNMSPAAEDDLRDAAHVLRKLKLRPHQVRNGWRWLLLLLPPPLLLGPRNHIFRTCYCYCAPHALRSDAMAASNEATAMTGTESAA